MYVRRAAFKSEIKAARGPAREQSEIIRKESDYVTQHLARKREMLMSRAHACDDR